MIKTSRFHRGAHDGQMGTIIHIDPKKNNCKSAHFFVRVDYELQPTVAWLFEDEMVAVDN